jgi:hypothetical protein
VAVKGFLESVAPLQVTGWVYDTAMPDGTVMVELTCRGVSLGRTLANVYRKDLETAQVGRGDHAFVFNLEAPLVPEEMAGIAVAALVDDAAPVLLARLVPAVQDEPKAALVTVVFGGSAQDYVHRPVFILGSARSGTSAVTQALLASTSYLGQEEGHFLDILAPLTVHLNGFYASKSDEYATGRNTMIAHVPQTYVQDMLAHGMIMAMRQIFPEGLWLDKTPSVNMIHLAPVFQKIWPQARFIFMKRRGIENIMSRQRKFAYDFSQNCREWKMAMEAWLGVREMVAGAALELDQHFMATNPGEAAAAIGGLLALSATDTGRLGVALGTLRPQRTGKAFTETLSLAETGWSATEMQIFDEICGSVMAKYGYSMTAAYYKIQAGPQGVVAL